MTTEDFRAFSHARILILVAALLFPIACSEDDGGTGPGGDSGKIVTGESAQVLQGNLGSEGGTVAVTQSDAALNGLELTVPSGAYSSGIQISVHEAQIESHDFGADFDPVSPLIRVDNGGEFAGIPMTLHIPLPDLQGRFPVAFYYDRTGRGLPRCRGSALLGNRCLRHTDRTPQTGRRFSHALRSGRQRMVLRQLWHIS